MGTRNQKYGSYDDSAVKEAVVSWWNAVFPKNRVRINPDDFGVDLLGIDDPSFAIEVERSVTWTDKQRPWTNMNIPIRKADYWFNRDRNTYFLQTNADMTSCCVLADDVIRTKYRRKWRDTKHGKEMFLQYDQQHQWYDMEERQLALSL